MFHYLINWSKILFSICLRTLYCLPLGAIALDDHGLKNKFTQPPPEWMIEQIKKDLAPFQEKGLSSEMLDDLWKNSGDTRGKLLVRFRIVNGVLSTISSVPEKEFIRLNAVRGALEKLNALKTLPNLDFIVTLHDGYIEDLPIFTFAKNKHVQGGILIPDFEALLGYQQLTNNVMAASAQYPWEVKLKRAFWRGSSTGGDYCMSNWHQFPRAKLVLHSFSSPRDLDAKFTSLVQMDNETRHFLTGRGFLGMPFSTFDHIRYKYLVEVDGNSCSYSRCYWELLSNSVVLKQVSDNIQWYYGAIKPYEHFIPLEEDLADFFLKLNWARNHDEECKRIAHNATRFVLQELSPENIYLYLYFVLEEYAKICHVSTENRV